MAVEVISLEYMMMVLAGGCWCSVLVFTSLASALESPPHWTGLDREREKLPGFLDSALPVPARPSQRTRPDIWGLLQDELLIINMKRTIV